MLSVQQDLHLHINQFNISFAVYLLADSQC